MESEMNKPKVKTDLPTELVLFIDYKLKSKGHATWEELDKRCDLEKLLNELLKKEQLGIIDGTSSGGGEMWISCSVSVINYEKAKKIIIHALKDTQFSGFKIDTQI